MALKTVSDWVAIFLRWTGKSSNNKLKPERQEGPTHAKTEMAGMGSGAVEAVTEGNRHADFGIFLEAK